MRKITAPYVAAFLLLCTSFLFSVPLHAQTPAFPGAEGFGRYAKGARAVSSPQVYVVTSLADSGPGSFRDAVSVPGRVVVFAVGGIINLASDVVVAANTTIAGQTAPGDGIVLFGRRVTFSGSSNTICRFLRIRLGAANNSGNDASGLANGSNMIFDHMSFTWGMDEVFSINWDGKGTAPDNITVQNSIIGQGLHRENHSAGGLIQTPDGGRVSLFRNLYISNKTRNPKVKGVNEFVNNVVYDWGNGNRLGDQLNYGWSGDAYIMGGSSGVSEVNIINNYFVSGPLTPPSKTTPFSRGTGTFNLFGAGNYFDKDMNGALDGTLVPYDSIGYPGITSFRTSPYDYPNANPALTAEQAYTWIIDSVGPCYPRRDQVDSLMVSEVASRGTNGFYVYRESDLPFVNGGVGAVFNGPAPVDTDKDGMPDAWEDAHGLNKNNSADAVLYSATAPEYLNIEVYINSLLTTPPAAFIKPPTNVTLSATSVELPSPSSKVVVGWTDNATNEAYFVLERSLDGVSFTDINHPAANSTTYTDNAGLVPNTTYYYRIKAVNADGSSTYSAVVSIKTPPIPTAPAAAGTPTPANGAQYVDLAAGKVTLKWTGSSNTTTYAVYFGTAAGALVKKAEVAYAAAPSYTVSGLTDYTTYYWRIDATNSKGTTEGPVWAFRTTKVIPEGMVGYWAFDETEGRVVTDSSEYGDHGILGLDDDDQSIRVAGKVKGGIDFATADPNMYVVSVPHQDQLYLDKGSFSLSFWMKAPASLLPSDATTSAYLLCKGSITRNAATGATGKRFDIEFKTKILRFAIDDDNDAGGGGKDELQTDATPFFTGNWMHVVAIRDTGARKLQVYLNGVLIREISATKAKSIGEASDLVIGNIGALEFLATSNKPAPYKGMLDELKIFNYAMTASQVMEQFYTSPLPFQPYAPVPADSALLEGFDNSVAVSWKGGLKTTGYKIYFGTDPDNLTYLADVPLNSPSYSFGNLAVMTTYYWRVDAVGPAGTTTGAVWTFKAVSPKGMVGHWKLDETTGTIAKDNSNYHVDGTVVGMTPVWTGGKFDNALQYSNPSSTGAVSVPHSEHLMFDQNSFSVSLWVKLTSGNSNYNSAVGKDCYLIQKGQFTDPGGKWYGIQLRDSSLTFAIDDAVLKSSISVSVKKATPYYIFNNNWANIVAIRDITSKQIKLYINGTLAASGSYSTTGAIGKLLPLLIGNSLENKPFHDLMDDVRLYNYALSPAEIASLVSGTPLVTKATNPAPANGTPDVSYGDVPLSWSGTGQTYNLYVGDAPGNVTLKAAHLSSRSYLLQNVNLLQPWYWRVDAVRDGEVATGDVWSFTAVDQVKPAVLTRNITVNLDKDGHATITPAQVDNGSYDDYGIAGMALRTSSFDCSNVGPNEVTLTVTDNNGNIETGTLTVTVADATAPAVVTKNVSVTLRNGAATLSAADVNNGSSDACGIQGMSLDKTAFTCADIGIKTVELTVTDVHGNSNSATAQVTVTGTIPAPSVTVSRLDNTYTGGPANTIYLGYGAQQVTLTAANAVAGTTQYSWSPAEGLSSAAAANPVFTPTQAGTYTFVVTATSEFGCSASAPVTVNVIDARCGTNGTNIVVCHKGNTLCVASTSVPAHLAHGCHIGACESLLTRTAGSNEGEAVLVHKALTVYPSPAKGSCTVAFAPDTKGAYRVDLYTAEGQLVRTLSKGTAGGATYVSYPLNTSRLPSGVYYVKLVSESGTTTSRFVVSH